MPLLRDPLFNRAPYAGYPAFLWAAVLEAVVILGAIALRSLNSTANPVSRGFLRLNKFRSNLQPF